MPAALTECIVVGAVDQEHEIASFSNYGDSVDVCAPGVDVVSYSIKPEGFESMSGTSMAAPHISALSAMLCMYVPEASPAQIEKSIDVQLRTSEHRSMYSYVRLSIDRCTLRTSEHRSMYSYDV